MKKQTKKQNKTWKASKSCREGLHDDVAVANRSKDSFVTSDTPVIIVMNTEK